MYSSQQKKIRESKRRMICRSFRKQQCQKVKLNVASSEESKTIHSRRFYKEHRYKEQPVFLVKSKEHHQLVF